MAKAADIYLVNEVSGGPGSFTAPRDPTLAGYGRRAAGHTSRSNVSNSALRRPTWPSAVRDGKLTFPYRFISQSNRSRTVL